MLKGLSRRCRVVLRQFIAAWSTPAPRPQRIPREVAAAMRAERAARERCDCQAIGRAARRTYAERHAALRAELRGQA